MKRIVVIGSSNVDMIIKTDSLPKPGETVGNGVFARANGGKGANQATGAARAGGNVSFISCLGNDDFAPGIIKSFKNDKIDTRYVFIENNIASGIALIIVDKKGENSIAVAPGANSILGPEHILKAEGLIKEAEIILMQMEIPLESVYYAIDIAYKNKIKVLLNPAPARQLKDEYLCRIHTLVLNETEAKILTGSEVNSESRIIEASRLLLKKGPENIIITLGSKGALVKTSEIEQFIPAYKVNAVDTTAAGDIYCGSLAVAMVEGKSITEAVKFAGAASAISVTRLGAQPSAPDRKEIEEFMARYGT